MNQECPRPFQIPVSLLINILVLPRIEPMTMWSIKCSALAYCTTRPLLALHNKHHLIINFFGISASQPRNCNTSLSSLSSHHHHRHRQPIKNNQNTTMPPQTRNTTTISHDAARPAHPSAFKARKRAQSAADNENPTKKKNIDHCWTGPKGGQGGKLAKRQKGQKGQKHGNT